MIETKQQIQKTVYKYSYFLNDILGEGYSSQVYKGIHNETKQVVAIKVINFQTLVTPISQSLLKNEINIIKQLNHENLMKVYEVFQTRNNIYLICEFCSDGDLANILSSTNLSKKEIIDIFTQISKGVKALHDQKIIHRDIKPANILRLDGTYKLSDFGFAIVENDFESIIKKFHVGTPVYMAPETVQLNQYSEKSDIWSLGVVLYLMIFKELPFNQRKVEDIRIRQQEVHAKINNDKNLPKQIKFILIGMLEIEPLKRLSIDSVLLHLQNQKKLKCNSHQNIVCKILRRSSAHSPSNYGDSNKISKPLKTLPDELQEINEQIEHNSCNKNQTQRNNDLLDKEIYELYIGYSSQKQKREKKNNKDSTSKRKVQIQIPIVQSNYKQQLEKNMLIQENSDSQQNTNSNSTNETIKNSQFSNCQLQIQCPLISPSLPQSEDSINNRQDNKLQQKFHQSSSQNLIDSPRKQLKNVSSYSNLLDQNIYSNRPLNRNINLSIQKIRTATSVSKFKDQEQQVKIKEQLASYQANESLSATIQPTYKFLVFLNQSLKNFDQINTEEKQKCYFLLRKLLALKANAIKRFCPLIIQETLSQWIESFQQYYEKVVPVFYTNQDRKFNQYFNNDLEQFTKGFSKQLYQNLLNVNSQLHSKDLQVIQEVINDNLKQFNDPILFARRWENGQL
ncbi:unnamed protein product [Paramecium sonneborni]|uniref:Protein kinase domain-containing protein n=1 Tax=Paramecium sonneborni TaxID=65129 RepID=A0A8S1LGM5_9CILI|nr:unnamed protein product [Paramecium sonneborni]